MNIEIWNTKQQFVVTEEEEQDKLKKTYQQYKYLQFYFNVKMTGIQSAGMIQNIFDDKMQSNSGQNSVQNPFCIIADNISIFFRNSEKA